MKRRRHTPEQIVRKLREADRLLAQGKDVVEVCKALEVSEQNYVRLPCSRGHPRTNGFERIVTPLER